MVERYSEVLQHILLKTLNSGDPPRLKEEWEVQELCIYFSKLQVH